jgi:hypothetical protein
MNFQKLRGKWLQPRFGYMNLPLETHYVFYILGEVSHTIYPQLVRED